MTYPLLYINGGRGWDTKLKLATFVLHDEPKKKEIDENGEEV